MKRTSEFVSLGHPDKIADYISSYLLDRYLEQDPFTRFAVECQIKDSVVNLAGEVSSAYDMGFDEIRAHVIDAVKEIGYTMEYLKRWGAANTIGAENLRVNCYIGKQSPDISRGVDADGWGDQGIFWGMATPHEDYDFMARDHFEAKRLCDELFKRATKSIGIGLDIKTQVEMVDDSVSTVVVAAPCLTDEMQNLLVDCCQTYLVQEKMTKANLIVNGTGRYVVHGPVGDCGTTGRKLAVDFYGGNCRIGGGSPWTKDGTKADVALNLFARKIALQTARALGCTVYVAISSCIGRREISVSWFDDKHFQIGSLVEDRPAEDVIRALNLRQPTFAQRCREGLFFDIA